MNLHFLDSNIIMYVLGSAHPLKTPSVRTLEKIRAGTICVCANTEIFQEILYRYYAIDRKDLAHQACELLEAIADPILPVSHGEIIRARALLQNHPISVRDAIHAATLLNHRIPHILSADSHFDSIPGIRRIPPG
ncbi:MAG: type II toxin-antitoxin system VapC family toxin [Nitrospirae bacterium]|nr:type II toxin-antitoxin system VapC family toxin [Nitrospirota bacterium]